MEAFSLLQVQSRDFSNDVAADASSLAIKLRTFVELTMDIASASPRRYFFEVPLILNIWL